MSDRKKCIFISDMHIGAKRVPRESRYAYDWLSPSRTKMLEDFLRYLATVKDIEEIVLLGDIMDNWVYPVYEIPPTFEEIIESPDNKHVFAALKDLAARKKVIYMPGNHDMLITKECVDEKFPGITFDGNITHRNIL
ncbi:MAG: hypothetical protein DWB56_02185 [Candidatus Jettenia sp.]|uniref:Calcineurin-like phosphoesterase domain-containing protein n=1 Tax=Candidatus Jettenia caeni TaxID=247490 RepID=I3IJS8_9BACT|nr:metallophosphoesterase [Candidatus Jettenia sp. AMX1]MBC6927766.1 hypothetical protein [Candidatus Jettenia sp.]NUN23841.1 metallophosphoesterase [Candidatus Jettenia caeni]KAA0250319.1 MAG: hypothetical protein EDM77_05815 [Candidatus Jettenia sp. AMX1]MCE7879491.1 hypothetical protein [Candidatus Jettenia sp. AMX1]MCQ3926087.1 hypothetical protein [Candidatus Jettenia sp.]